MEYLNQEYDYRDRKIVAVVNKDITVGIAMNVVGHLSISLGALNNVGLMGRPTLVDKDGVGHAGIARYPLIITKTRSRKLSRAIEIAKNTESVFCTDYPTEMLGTEHDDDLMRAILLTSHGEITYLGALFYGESTKINSITGKFSLYG